MIYFAVLRCALLCCVLFCFAVVFVFCLPFVVCVFFSFGLGLGFRVWVTKWHSVHVICWRCALGQLFLSFVTCVAGVLCRDLLRFAFHPYLSLLCFCLPCFAVLWFVLLCCALICFALPFFCSVLCVKLLCFNLIYFALI